MPFVIIIVETNSTVINSILSGGIASLNVGTPETPFDIHLALLCDTSPYFDRLFKDRFTNVLPESVNLPDEDADSFTEFSNWLYTGTCFQSQLSPKLIDLFRLWILAEKLEVPDLQTFVVARCKQKFDLHKNGVIGTNAINYVYSKTSSGSLLRQLAVEFFARRGTKARFSEAMTELPRPFLEDLCEFWFEKKDADCFAANSFPNFDELRFTQPAVASDGNDRKSLSPGLKEDSETSQQTVAGTRIIKRPTSRRRSHRATSSTGIDTPPTASIDTEKDQEISQKLEELEV